MGTIHEFTRYIYVKGDEFPVANCLRKKAD